MTDDLYCVSAHGAHRRGTRVAPVVAVLVALVLMPSLLLAHQALRSSAPADEETVGAVPADLRLTFNEPVRIGFTEVSVRGPDGALRLGPLRRSSDDPRVLVVPVESGWHAGEFTLRWSTVGSDGHRTDGTVSFTVQAGADGLPPPAAGPETVDGSEAGERGERADSPISREPPTFGPSSPAFAGIRALLLVAVLGLLGAVALRLVVLPITARRSPEDGAALRAGIDRGAGRVGLTAAVTLLVAALARLWAQSASLFGVESALQPERLADALTLQPWAISWWLQAGAAVVATVGFVLVLRRVRVGWAVAASAAVLAAVSLALSGHSVAHSELAWLAVIVDALHVVGAGGWIGGLLVLVIVGMAAALRLEEGRRGAAAAALVHAFSPTALAFAGVLVATGVVSAWLQLGSVPALWKSGYGQTLLVKLGVFLLLTLVAAYNWLRVRPSVGQAEGAGRLRRSGTAELLLALAVIVVTAVLVAVPPPAQ